MTDEEIKKIVEEAMKDYEPPVVKVSPGMYRIGSKEHGYMYTGEGGAKDFLKALREVGENYNYEEESKPDSDTLFGQ